MSSAVLALAVANARYWAGVAPLARAQLRRWERRARAIPDPALRAIALDKLQAERFNAEVAATLATLAPRRQRALAVEAIVALEVAYDYLDGLTEQPATDPLRSGRGLFMAFTDALGATSARTGDYFRHHPSDDGGYLAALSATTSAALAALPAWSAVSDAALRSAARCAEAQVRVHAAPRAGAAQLREWATAQAAPTALEWREFMAGAVSSVLAVHALIAAAADVRTTPAQAAAIDSAYLSIGALSTMLDSVIDYERDSACGEAWYVRHYDSRAALADRITAVMRDARQQVQTLPNAAHHTMTLVGVVAYYTSAQEATQGIAAPLTQGVHDELEALMAPTLAVMRAWRGAKKLRRLTTGKRRTITYSIAALAGAAAVSTVASALAAGPVGASPSRGAQAARALNITDTAHLHFVRETASSTLIEEGKATGGLPGVVKVVFEVGATVKASFTLSSRYGALIGRGLAKPHSSGGEYSSFAGTLTITHGTARYARAHGRGGFYGTINRGNDAVTVQTAGALAY